MRDTEPTEGHGELGEIPSGADRETNYERY
jgi:hypothetical protein